MQTSPQFFEKLVVSVCRAVPSSLPRPALIKRDWAVEHALCALIAARVIVGVLIALVDAAGLEAAVYIPADRDPDLCIAADCLMVRLWRGRTRR